VGILLHFVAAYDLEVNDFPSCLVELDACLRLNAEMETDLDAASLQDIPSKEKTVESEEEKCPAFNLSALPSCNEDILLAEIHYMKQILKALPDMKDSFQVAIRQHHSFEESLQKGFKQMEEAFPACPSYDDHGLRIFLANSFAEGRRSEDDAQDELLAGVQDIKLFLDRVWDRVQDCDERVMLMGVATSDTLTACQQYEKVEKEKESLHHQLLICNEERARGCNHLFKAIGLPSEINCTSLTSMLNNIQTLLEIEKKGEQLSVVICMGFLIGLESFLLILVLFCYCQSAIAKRCVKKSVTQDQEE